MELPEQKEGIRLSVRNLARCALFVAAMTVCAWLAFPVPPIPFTLQSFALFLALLLLGGKYGSLVCAVYLLLGIVGLPVFSGFRGGFGMLLGVTGGYLWGFLLGCLIFWGITAIFGEKSKICAGIAAMFAVYLCGTIWYFVYAPGGLWAILAQSVLPYLLPDGLKLFLAFWVANRMQKSNKLN
jgi:biotin transport system substrate-specific component